MSAAVKLSRRSAETLLAMAEEAFWPEATAQKRAVVELRTALQLKPKSSAVRKTERKRREKAKETRSIYEQVAERAGGKCERCRLAFTHLNPAEMDHFFGRGKAPQSVENCWNLCRACHREKTANYPDALWWLATFREHCLTHGYHGEARKTEARMDFERAKRGGE